MHYSNSQIKRSANLLFTEEQLMQINGICFIWFIWTSDSEFINFCVGKSSLGHLLNGFHPNQRHSKERYTSLLTIYIVRLLIQHFLVIVWFFFGWYFGRPWRLVNLAKEIRLPTRDFRHLPWSRWREVIVVLNENKVFRAWKFNPIDSLYAFWLFSRWFQMIWLKERPRLLRIS